MKTTREMFLEEILDCIEKQYPKFYYKLITPIKIILDKYVEEIEKKAYNGWYEDWANAAANDIL